MAHSSLTREQRRIIFRAAQKRHGTARNIAILLRVPEHVVAYELRKLRSAA